MSVEPTLPMMYWPTEKPFEFLVVTQGDRNLASLAFGWTLGFGYFTTFNAVRETRRTSRINTYVVLIWGEIIACLTFSIVVWMYLMKAVPPSFWLFFVIVTAWAFQIQLLLQIIVNRVCILLNNERERNLLRFSIAGMILFINLSVYVVWLPARMQINSKFIDVNIWWDRVEKVLYLIIDGALNWFFIHIVKKRLVDNGLKKYNKLVTFNTRIIFVSLAMDILIIGMMFLRNDFVYTQFHSVAYTVKLNIEMAMSSLIIKVARDAGLKVSEDTTDYAGAKGGTINTTAARLQTSTVEVQVHRQQFTRRDDDIELTDAMDWPTGDESDNGQKCSKDDITIKRSSSDVFGQTPV